MACLNCGTKDCICESENYLFADDEHYCEICSFYKNSFCVKENVEITNPKSSCCNSFNKLNNFECIAIKIASLVEEKQKAYGNSFGKAKDFLKILYPEGIPVEKYNDMLTLVRIWDKIMRIATNKDALGESPYSDIMGYCLLALNEKEKK